jgi:hypothetical protein
MLPDDVGSTMPVERADHELTRWAPNNDVPPLPKRTAMPRIVQARQTQPPVDGGPDALADARDMLTWASEMACG